MKPFDDQFSDNVRRVFDEYTQDADHNAWEAMKARLEKQNKGRIVGIIPIRTLVVAAAVVVLAVAGISLILLRPAEELVFADLPEKPLHSAMPIPASDITSLPLPGPYHAIMPRSLTGVLVSYKKPQPDDPFFMPSLIKNISANTAPSSHGKINVMHSFDDYTATAYVMDDAFIPDDHASDDSRVFTWGISASTMLVSAEQQITRRPGVSGGITAKLDISPVVSLSLGGMLIRQQLSIKNLDAEHFDDYIRVQHLPGAEYHVTGQNRMDILALEFPLSARVKLFENPGNRLYLGAGLSSMLYIRQRFSGHNTLYVNYFEYDNQTGGYSFASLIDHFFVDERHDAFSHFDFSRLLYISFGYEVVGKERSVVIEPFIKYPLDHLSSRQLRIGMAGLSLKYDFLK